MKPPYNISSINQKAVLKKLENIEDYNKDRFRKYKVKGKDFQNFWEKLKLLKRFILQMQIFFL